MVVGKLRIKNFKSIKDLELNCRKINVFIGEPNAGKSNILEAIGLVSHVPYGHIFQFVRLETMLDLFYDRNLSDPISIDFDQYKMEVVYDQGFHGRLIFVGQQPATRLDLFHYGYEGGGQNRRGVFEGKWNILERFKFYRFKMLPSFPEVFSDFLSPPSGANLLHIILTRKDLKKAASDLFRKFGYRIVFKPQEGKIEVQKDLEDIIVSIPYALSSETLQRMVFYLAAIHSNQDSIISFEEPEAHAFPYYTKYLAERIALDNMNNQYFIATHNPYFLSPIIEKTPKTEIATFVTYFENYQTKTKQLSESEIERALAMGPDFFFNLDRFLEKQSVEGSQKK
jgi:hypothetical protein